MINDKKLNRTATLTQLVWMAIVAVAGGSKAFYDISSNSQEINILKQDVKEGHQLDIKNDKDIAVIKSELEAVRRQNSVLIIKLDELYKMMINKQP